MSDDRDDATLSRDIAREAGQLLLQMRREFYDEHAAPVTSRQPTACGMQRMRAPTI
jgi:hypothetical protein